MLLGQRNFIPITNFVKLCGNQGRKEELIYKTTII